MVIVETRIPISYRFVACWLTAVQGPRAENDALTIWSNTLEIYHKAVRTGNRCREARQGVITGVLQICAVGRTPDVMEHIGGNEEECLLSILRGFAYNFLQAHERLCVRYEAKLYNVDHGK